MKKIGVVRAVVSDKKGTITDVFEKAIYTTSRKYLDLFTCELISRALTEGNKIEIEIINKE